MTYAKRKIDVTFLLGTGAFGETGFNTVTVSGLRVQVHIVKAGGDSMGEMRMRIHGLDPTVVNELTAITQYVMMARKNRVIVTAGDDVNGMGIVFKGDIAQGWADLNSAPDTALEIIAFAGLFPKLKPTVPLSFPGPVSVDQIMQGIAQTMNVDFRNNGVSVMLSKAYFPGTAWEQARRCAEQANIEWTIDDDELAIWPKGGTRFGPKPIISPNTGMVGYPAYNGVGVSLTTEFNRQIRFGQTVTVQSSIKPACGDWFVFALSHDLASETPGGEWFTHLEGRPLYNLNAIVRPQ